MAEAAFKEVGASSAFEILLCKRFQDRWEWIDKQKFEDGMIDDVVRALVLPVKDKITNFISNALQDSQPRDDYCEGLELASIFLGNLPEGCIFLLQVLCTMHGGWQRFFTLSRFGCSGLNSN